MDNTWIAEYSGILRPVFKSALKAADHVLEELDKRGLYENSPELRTLGYLENWNISVIKISKGVRACGKARYEWKGRDLLPFNADILISEWILNKPEKLRNTMTHEVFHIVANQMTGTSQDHGGLWADMAHMYNELYPDRMPITAKYTESKVFTEEETRQRYKWEVYCPECGHVWHYTRRCKTVDNPEEYIHRRCGATLKSRKVA